MVSVPGERDTDPAVIGDHFGLRFFGHTDHKKAASSQCERLYCGRYSYRAWGVGADSGFFGGADGFCQRHCFGLYRLWRGTVFSKGDIGPNRAFGCADHRSGSAGRRVCGFCGHVLGLLSGWGAFPAVGGHCHGHSPGQHRYDHSSVPGQRGICQHPFAGGSPGRCGLSVGFFHCGGRGQWQRYGQLFLERDAAAHFV